MTFQRVAMLNYHGVFYRKFALCSAFLLFLIVVSTTAAGGKISKGKDCRYRKGIENEKPCLSRGGICVKADQCAKDQMAQGKGLCPKQESSGVVCCHKGSEGRTCRDQGGECMKEKDCKGSETDHGKVNCKEGESCCILVKH